MVLLRIFDGFLFIEGAIDGKNEHNMFLTN